jgi:hypothetical protein
MKNLQRSILTVFFLVYGANLVFCDSTEAFQRLKALEGKWEGIAKWTGARNDEYKLDAIYSLTGHGTAVIEDLVVENERMMTSIYHLDGDTLRMTHYCVTGNQPRLIESSYDPVAAKIMFKMVDITNLSRPGAPHVFGSEMLFQSPTEIILSFQFTAEGKVSTERIQLHKVQ